MQRKCNIALPYALPLCHYLVPLLKGPVASTFGHLCLLQGLLQLLRDGLILLPQHIDLLVGSLHVQSGRVLFLGELREMQGDEVQYKGCEQQGALI